jgi:hypothetical protein
MTRARYVLNFLALAGMAYGVYACSDELRPLAIVLALGLWFIKPHAPGNE